MKRYQPPKAIANHPGVEECGHGPAEGIEDYKHAVWLREGWLFTRGRMVACRTGNFNTVAEFKRAAPGRVTP